MSTKKGGLRERWEKSAEEADKRQRDMLERKASKRNKLNDMTVAEVIGKYWFYFAALLLILFPVMDIMQRLQAVADPSLGTPPALSLVFLTNGRWGLVFSLPVFLAYGIDYLLAKKKGEPWREMKQKRFRVVFLLGLGLLWLVLGLIFLLFGM